MKGKKKGSPKTGGRLKGSLNTLTRPLKELISSYSQDKFSRFIIEMDRLEGSEYVKAYLSLLEYSLPKLQRSEIMGEVSSHSFPIENDITREERRLIINRLRQEIKEERKNE